MKKLLLLSALTWLTVLGIQAQRVTDKLSRGLVAIPQGDKTGQDGSYGTSGTGMLVTWRILPTEYYDTKYNLYRDGTKVNSEPLSVSNYQDNSGTASSTYYVIPVVKGNERTDLKSETVKPWAHQFWEIPAAKVINRAGDDVTSQYSLNDCSVADVDGDGQMEFVVKRRNDQNLNVAGNTTTFNRHECYKMDGTLLWYIDMGPNMMSGPDEQFDLILYDWDQDGRAEALMRGADNMIIHTASGKEIKIGNMDYYAPRDEYTREGAEYLLYMNGSTGEPYGWDGSDNWTPAAYPLPRFEVGESDYATVWGKNDTGHRAMKHYFGAPYLDGRNAAIFLGRGCYTRHKFCALSVNKETHELTQLWRWNCYDSSSPWFGNGFHNFAIADVDMDGRDEIVFGSMIIDDNGYGLSTTGYGHGDAQHCGDLDPYRWGLEQFVCLESATVPGIAYTDATSSTLRYTTGGGSDNGRCMAGNFYNTYPGAIGISGNAISLVADQVIPSLTGFSDDHVNMRVYWDGDLLDEFMDSPGVERSPCVYKAPGQTEVGTGRTYTNSRCWLGQGNLNNSSKNNPCFLGDILGDWREEIVSRTSDKLIIQTTSYESPWGITTLWADHEYRNAMTWQCVGYNQPPHTSFFLGELEGITNCPPAITLEGRTEIANGGTVQTTDAHLLISGYEDKTVSVSDGASPYILTVNAPALVSGTGSQQATGSTPKQPERTVTTFTTTLTGGAFSGATRLVKQGEGVLVLPNVVEKHTGETNIWQGTLQFDGTFESSPLWLNRHTTLVSDGGKFMGGIKADYNSTILIGGKGHVGSLTASSLELGFGSRLVFDFIGGQIDQLNATSISIETKDWDYGPVYSRPVIQFNTEAQLAPGEYVLGTIGEVNGKLSDFAIEGLPNSQRAVLSVNEGKLIVTIESSRAGAEIVWNGTSDNNVWQQTVSTNFLNGGVADFSVDGDDITFDDTAAETSLTIRDKVSPHSVTFNNSTKSYTISGDSIVGGGKLVKYGTGKLTLNNWNYVGRTSIYGGTVSVAMLANNSGQAVGSLGNASQQIDMYDGTTLVTNGTIITTQTLNVSDDVTISVPSGKSVIFNTGIKGNGHIVKTGAGSMETTSGNTYKRLTINAGTMTSGYNSSHIEDLPDTVEFTGGTLWAANDEGTNVTNRANFVVPASKKGTIYCGYRSVYTGSLTGAGTFNVYTGGVRCYFDGDWSEFTGTINAKKNNRQNKKSYDPSWMFRNTKGLPNATLSVDEGVNASNEGHDIELGGLGTGKGRLVGNGKWIVTINSNSTFTHMLGIPVAYTDAYGKAVSTAKSSLVKRGTGALKFNTPASADKQTVNGNVTVEEGKLWFKDTNSEYYINGSGNTLTASGSGRIAGCGKVYNLVVNDGGTVVPCAPLAATLENVTGVLTVAMSTTVNEGGVLEFPVTSSYSSLKSYNVTLNGTVKVTPTSSFKPATGAEYQLLDVAGKLKGEPTFDLPDLGADLAWDTSDFMTSGKLKIVEATGISKVNASTVMDCAVYNTSGQLVGTFSSTHAAAAQQASRLPLRAGSYIVRMTSGKTTLTRKISIR